MAHELDRLFQKIRNGAALLSTEDFDLMVRVLTKEKDTMLECWDKQMETTGLAMVKIDLP